MTQKTAKTNRQKMEDLLVEIYRESNFREMIVRDRDHETLYLFDGKLGDQVTFNGGFFDGDNADRSRVEINLEYQGNALARIATEHGFINPRLMALWSGFVPFPSLHGIEETQPIADTTDINVISPRWAEVNGVCDTTYTKDLKKQLTVFHSPFETVDAVIAQICAVVAHSKDHAVIAKKLSKLNLPSNIKIKNVDALADKIVDQIHREGI